MTVQQIRERYNRLRDSSDIPDKTAPAFSTEDVGKLLAEIDGSPPPTARPSGRALIWIDVKVGQMWTTRSCTVDLPAPRAFRISTVVAAITALAAELAEEVFR